LAPKLGKSSGAARVLVRPKNLQYEAIEIGEVTRRIRVAIPDFSDDLCRLFGWVVMMSTPLPTELALYLRDTVSALRGTYGFVSGSITNEQSAGLCMEFANELFEFHGHLDQVRDRMHRVCSHHDIEVLADKKRRCKACKGLWEPGDGALARLVTGRSHSDLVAGQQRPGRNAFLFLATEILRKHGHKKLPAMRLACRVIELFLPVSDPEKLTDLRLDRAYLAGKASAKKNMLSSADDVLHYGYSLFQALESCLIWVPYRGKTSSKTVTP
jgi:hypothetical protein